MRCLTDSQCKSCRAAVVCDRRLRPSTSQGGSVLRALKWHQCRGGKADKDRVAVVQAVPRSRPKSAWAIPVPVVNYASAYSPSRSPSQAEAPALNVCYATFKTHSMYVHRLSVVTPSLRYKLATFARIPRVPYRTSRLATWLPKRLFYRSRPHDQPNPSMCSAADYRSSTALGTHSNRVNNKLKVMSQVSTGPYDLWWAGHTGPQQLWPQTSAHFAYLAYWTIRPYTY